MGARGLWACTHGARWLSVRPIVRNINLDVKTLTLARGGGIEMAASIGKYLNTQDIMLIVLGLALILLGGLVATIYTGVADMITKQFGQMTNTTITNYVTAVASYVPLVLNMLGLVLVIVAVAHILYVLISTLRGAAGEAAAARP